MHIIKSMYDFILVTLGSLFGWMFGGFTGSLKVLAFFLILDMILGISDVVVNKTSKLNAETAFSGVVRKFSEFLIISMCHVLDVYVIKSGDILMQAACFLLIGTEGISILTHMKHLGVPIPNKLMSVLEQLRSIDDDLDTNIISSDSIKNLVKQNDSENSSKVDSETISDIAGFISDIAKELEKDKEDENNNTK